LSSYLDIRASNLQGRHLHIPSIISANHNKLKHSEGLPERGIAVSLWGLVHTKT
jgi:hypothetical protein